jgi:hypothetical protein
MFDYNCSDFLWGCNIDHSKSLEGVSLTEITGLEDIVVFSFSKLDFVIVRV